MTSTYSQRGSTQIIRLEIKSFGNLCNQSSSPQSQLGSWPPNSMQILLPRNTRGRALALPIQSESWTVRTNPKQVSSEARHSAAVVVIQANLTLWRLAVGTRHIKRPSSSRRTIFLYLGKERLSLNTHYEKICLVVLVGPLAAYPRARSWFLTLRSGLFIARDYTVARAS